MIRGMTGFGRAVSSSGAGRATAEIRSTNHRYFELITHLPPSFNIFEDRIRREIQKEIKRGRLVFVLTFSHTGAPKVYLNTMLAKNYFNQLKRLSRELKLKEDITLHRVAGLEGVLGVVDEEQPSEAMWLLIQNATQAALGHLVRMRKAEGKSIYNDITKKLNQADGLARSISERRRAIFQAKRKTLSSEELQAFAADRDINEEVTRLKFHLGSLKKQLNGSSSVGKEIDFISQELQRETNTIGSKLPDTKVSHYVIKIKSLIEQIREQAQNTE